MWPAFHALGRWGPNISVTTAESLFSTPFSVCGLCVSSPTGTAPVRGGRRERAEEQPVALLKFPSVNCSRDPGGQHGDGDGGGRSDIVVLHNIDEIEELLLQEGQSKLETAHTGDHQR